MTFILAPHINWHVYTSFLSARCKQFLEDTDWVLFILVWFSPGFHRSIIWNIELNTVREMNEWMTKMYELMKEQIKGYNKGSWIYSHCWKPLLMKWDFWRCPCSTLEVHLAQCLSLSSSASERWTNKRMGLFSWLWALFKPSCWPLKPRLVCLPKAFIYSVCIPPPPTVTLKLICLEMKNRFYL